MADKRDDELELFFDVARAETPVPSQDVLARILADADKMMPVAPVQAPARAPGLWAGLLAAVGGWPAVAGMATATVAGVWIGFAQPDGVGDLATGILPDMIAYEVVDLFPSYDGLLVEG